jgi:hypothetical protein
MELIEQIRAKCIEVNPEKDWRYDTLTDSNEWVKTVHLADVLLAMPVGIHLKTMGEQARIVAYDEEDEHIGLEWWDLKNDDLEKQSPETIEFIGRVLGITS